MSGLDISKRRTPSELRNLLETRVRRQAETYDVEVRVQALEELRDLAGAALLHLAAPEQDSEGIAFEEGESE
jgi:hypothetical protein